MNNIKSTLAHIALFLLTILLLGSGNPADAQGNAALITIPANIPAGTNGAAVAPISITTNGHSISAAIFSIDFDETQLSISGNIADAVTFNLPDSYTTRLTYDQTDTDGEIDIAIFTLDDPPTLLTDGEIARVTFATGDAGVAALNFSQDPPASFGSPNGGASIPTSSEDGSFAVGDAVVVDFSCSPRTGTVPLTVTCENFSTGDVSGWLWDINGVTTTEHTPAAQTFTADGSYSVKLTATPANGTPDIVKERANYIQVGDTWNVELPLESGGELSVTWNPVIFRNTELAGEDVLVNAIDTTWQAADLTNLGAGWHVTMIAEGDLIGVETGRSIPIGTEHGFKVGCDNDEIVSQSGGDNTNHPTCSNVLPIPNAGRGEAPITLLAADAGKGLGVFDFVPHFQQRLAGNTIIDTYRATIHVDIVAGP